MRIRPRFGDGGFTLVELLMASALLGVVVAAACSLFLQFKKTTGNQEEIVDIQQSLRVALDLLSRDIRMAGLLIEKKDPGVNGGSDRTTLNLTTASPFYAFAMLSAGREVPAGTTAAEEITFRILEPEMVDLFAAGHQVRIVRPEDGRQPFDPPPGADLTVKGTQRGTPSLTLAGFACPDAVHYKAGDMIARVGANAPDPSTIRWNLADSDLKRAVDGAGGGEVVVSDVEAVQFDYLLDDGFFVEEPDSDQRGRIVGIRVQLTARAPEKPGEAARGRSLSSLVRIRN